MPDTPTTAYLKRRFGDQYREQVFAAELDRRLGKDAGQRDTIADPADDIDRELARRLGRLDPTPPHPSGITRRDIETEIATRTGAKP